MEPSSPLGTIHIFQFANGYGCAAQQNSFETWDLRVLRWNKGGGYVRTLISYLNEDDMLALLKLIEALP